MSSDPPIKSDFAGNRFATTRWSLILSCGSSSGGNEVARGALAELCQIYWRPIFAFICKCGYSESDAQDLTQEFLLMTIEGNLLSVADPRRGRFRSLLLKALQNFLRDNRDRCTAEKRGGRREKIPWHDWIAESPSHFATAFGRLENWTPEKIFDLRWAITVIERALCRLEEECENCGRQRMFTILRKYLMADRSEVSYGALSVEVGVPVRSVAKVLYHLRIRYRELLRDEVSQTVGAADDVDEEIRYLCSVLAASGG